MRCGLRRACCLTLFDIYACYEGLDSWIYSWSKNRKTMSIHMLKNAMAFLLWLYRLLNTFVWRLYIKIKNKYPVTCSMYVASMWNGQSLWIHLLKRSFKWLFWRMLQKMLFSCTQMRMFLLFFKRYEVSSHNIDSNNLSFVCNIYQWQSWDILKRILLHSHYLVILNNPFNYVFVQVHYWGALGFEIPLVASSFLRRQHDYQLVLSDVFRMARDHNKVILNSINC